MSLPLIKGGDQTMQLVQTKWKSEIDPVLNNPLTNPVILKDVSLINGVTVVNHRLGRTMQGWIVSDLNAAAQIYRSQPFNNLTITLTSSAACVVNLVVF